MIIHSQAYTVTSSAVSFCLLHQPHNLYHYALRTLVLLQHWSDGLSVPLEIVHLFYTISVVQFLLTRCRSSFVTLHMKPFKDFFSHIFLFFQWHPHIVISLVKITTNTMFQLTQIFHLEFSCLHFLHNNQCVVIAGVNDQVIYPFYQDYLFILWCSCVNIKLKSTKLFPLLCSCNILFQLLPDCFSPYSYYFNLSFASHSATF